MDPAELLRDVAARWLGAGSHPGGAALTRSLLADLPLAPRSTVLDVGTGRGRTLDLLRRRGLQPVGVDVAEPRVRAARRRTRRTARAVVRPPVVVAVADAARLPLADGSVDAAVAECVLSTLDDPHAAAAELLRVVRPGGWLAVSDVTVRPELATRYPSVQAATLAITTPQPPEVWPAMLAGAGWDVQATRPAAWAADATVRRVRQRLFPATVLPAGRRARTTAAAAQTAVRDGLLGYAVVVARRPGRT